MKSHFLEEKSEFIVKKDDILIGLTEGTEEGSKRLIEDIVNDDEFKNVITSNNTDSNKRDKLQKIISDKNIKTLDINHKLYDYFEKEDVREKMIRMFISRPELLNQLRG